MRLEARPVRMLARKFGRAAPVLSMLMLLAWPTLLAGGGATEADLARQRAIATAMSEVPQLLGRWAGQDVAVPTEATQILRPNAILSRRYSEIGGSRSVTLAFIHCADVRDMLGHFPPVCYPANGWTLDPSAATQLVVKADDGRTWPVKFYRFTRAERGGALITMSVLNAFLLPDGRLATEMDALMERSIQKAVSARGVAQIQFVFDGDVPADDAASVAKELLSALPDALMRHLGVEQPSDSAGTPSVRGAQGEP